MWQGKDRARRDQNNDYDMLLERKPTQGEWESERS